jgi:hypothetical protein
VPPAVRIISTKCLVRSGFGGRLTAVVGGTGKYQIAHNSEILPAAKAMPPLAVHQSFARISGMPHLIHQMLMASVC